MRRLRWTPACTVHMFANPRRDSDWEAVIIPYVCLGVSVGGGKSTNTKYMQECINKACKTFGLDPAKILPILVPNTSMAALETNMVSPRLCLVS